MKIPANVVAKPEAARVASILEGLDENVPGAEVFEAFEQLDDLPADVVRAVLVSVTGPAPDPDQLDAATRRAHGFPELPLVFRCTSALRPSVLEELNRVEQDQLRAAGTSWDGLDLPPSARIAPNGGEPSFAGALELKRFAFDDGTPALDVVLYGEGSGAIFDGGTSRIVGAIAYGVVEMKDKAARAGLQNVLSSQPDPAALARAEAARAKADAAAKAAADARAKADAKADAEAKAAAKAAAKAKAEADAAAFAAAQTELFPAEEPTTQKRLKVVAAKKVAAKKTAAAPKKVAAKKTAAAPKKVAAKKTAAAAEPKKVAAKKTAAAAPKKTAATKTAAAEPKKGSAKKTAAAAEPKKTAAKKTAAAPKKAAAKKAAAAAPKKAAAKKAAAAAPKKTAAKKTAAKKTAAKTTAAAKKTAAATPKKAAAKKTTAKKTR